MDGKKVGIVHLKLITTIKINNMWIAEVTWRDNSRYYFGPFTEYEAGIKKWSAEFSYKYGSMVECIDYHKLNEPKLWDGNQQ